MRRNPALESQSSFERIQQLVKKEGKIARNLVVWSVPAEKQAKAARGRGRTGKAGGRRPLRSRGSEQLSRSDRMCLAAAGQYSNSALGGKEGRPANKSDVHARYWSYLFDNLFRAVDEIYKTCEVDGSVIECQVHLHASVCACTLLYCASHCIYCTGGNDDPECLPQRLLCSHSQNRTGEAVGDTPTTQVSVLPAIWIVHSLMCTCMHSFRPSGVAWEVRKTTSPSKLCKPHLCDQAKPRESGGRSVSGCVRSLDMSCSSLTWADRVRGKALCVSREEEDSDAHDQGTKEEKKRSEAGEEVEDGRRKREGQEGEEVERRERRESREDVIKSKEDDTRGGEERGKDISKEASRCASSSSLEVRSMEQPQEGCEEINNDAGKVLTLDTAEVKLMLQCQL